MAGTLSWAYGKPFGYKNKPWTCRWCGDSLRKDGDHGLGYRGNGKFCSIRCGYQWAVRSA